MKITSETVYLADVVDVMLRDHVSTAGGVSTGPYGTILHLPDGASASDQNKAQKIFDNWDNLTITIDKTSMDVGDADPVITYDTADTDVGFVVLLDGKIYASGSEAPVAGTVTLELDAPEAGDYDIYVYRRQGNFASGSVSITVNEV